MRGQGRRSTWRERLVGAAVVSISVATISAAAVSCGSAQQPTGSAQQSTGSSQAPSGSSSSGLFPATPASTCADTPPERLVPQVVAQHPHDATAFTQGLLLADGTLYESTGRYGESSIRVADVESGEVLRSGDVPDDSFAEGLAIGPDGRLVQLTWKEGRAFVRDPETLQIVDEHRYDGEGWGITTLDDGSFVTSDGSDRLTVRDPATFEVLRVVTVRRADGAADQLNELEWDGSHLWANRWQTDEIVRIDPVCARVDAVVDAGSLETVAQQAAAGAPIDVLNGIAHVPGSDRFLITGKYWPVLADVRFVPA